MDTITRRRLAPAIAALALSVGALSVGLHIATNTPTHPVYVQTWEGDQAVGDHKCVKAGYRWDGQETYKCDGVEAVDQFAAIQSCIARPDGPDGQPFIRCGTATVSGTYPNTRRFEAAR